MSEVNALEKQRDDAKLLIERRERALRLFNNRDFKAIILDYFCTEECARYAQASANPALKPEERADALAMAQAPGHLRRFLSVLVQMGNAAEGQMTELDDAIAQARAEEDLQDDLFDDEGED